MAQYHKVRPRYIVDSGDTGFAFKGGPKMVMYCANYGPLTTSLEQQTVRGSAEDLSSIGFKDRFGDPDKRYLKKVTNEAINDVDSSSSRTGSRTITEEYSLNRQRIGGKISLTTAYTETLSRFEDDDEITITCDDNTFEYTRSYNFIHSFEKLEAEGFIAHTRSKMRLSYNSFRCVLDSQGNETGSFEALTVYGFVPTSMPTDSVIYTGEITEQALLDRWDETIEKGKEIWDQIDGPLNLRALGADRGWDYPLNKLAYYDIINDEPVDSDTGSFGSIGELKFDVAAWEADIQNRLNHAKEEFGFKDDVTVTNEEGEEVQVNYYDNEIARIQSELATLDEEEEAALEEYDQAKAEYEAAEANLQEKASLLETLEWRMQFGSSDLSDAELSSLQNQIDAASQADGEAYEALQDLDFPGESSGTPYRVQVNRTSHYQVEREKLNLEIAEMNRLKVNQSAYFDPVEEAIFKNRAYPGFSFEHSPEDNIVQVDEDAEPHIVGRYRITMELDEAYDFSDGSRTVTVEWREQTATTNEQGETTYTYVEKSEDISVSAAGRHVGAWHEPAVPATANTKIKVVEPETKNLPSYTPFIDETQARKRGVYGYTHSDPPKVYRSEVFSGGFPGCADLDMPAKTYSGKREYPDREPSFEVFDMLWPIGESFPTWQPSIGEGNLFSWSAGGQRISYVEQTDTTRVYYREDIQCGENKLTDELIGTLEGEITTGEIITSVDNFIAESISYQEGKPYPIGEAPDFPENPEMYISNEEIWGTLFGRHLLLWEGALFPLFAWRILEPDELGYFRRSGYIEVGPIRQFPADEAGEVTVSYKKHIYEVATGNVTVTDETIDVALETSAGEEPTKIDLEPLMGQVMWISDLQYDERPGDKRGNPQITAVSP